jgi:hypothetical protein
MTTLRLALFSFALLALPALLHAQGGIGNMPRQDLVMLRAVEQDSLSEIVFNKILDLRRYAAADQTDSAALMIAYNGSAAAPVGKWARPINLQNADEKTRVDALMAKAKKLFADLPETERKYYACFKDKDNPAGQKHLYQISHKNGKKSRMVSWTFYPINGTMMLGDFN